MTLNMLATYILADNNGGAGSITNILRSAADTLNAWGKYFLVLLGIVMVVYGVYQIGKGMMSGGRGQTNWAMAIGCIILGGAIAVTGGWGFVVKIAQGSGNELNEMSNNTNGSGSISDNVTNSTIIIGDNLICTFDE